VTPQVGVIWEPTMSQYYYVSYSSSAKPTGVSVGNGDPVSDANDALEPEENTNIEAGARVGLFGDRMLLQGAVFQTKKDNAKEFDATGNELARSGDSQEITGAEFGIAGAINDQWSLNATYTYIQAETTDCAPVPPPAGSPPGTLPTPCPNIGREVAFTPKHAASLWSTYNFTGGLAGLEIGGGLTYQDDVFLNVQNTAVSPDYVTFDAFVSYGWDRFRFSVNAYNLTDELYYSQVHGNRVTPAPARTVIATLGVVY
jgi:catecholate siderophore receptor